MPSGFRIEVSGLERTLRGLDEFERYLPTILGGLLYREGVRILAKSIPLVPVDSGRLKNSGHTELPRQLGSIIEVMIVFGGAAREYAIYVHEDLTTTHKAPTQAKFLEQPLLDALPTMLSRLRVEARGMFLAFAQQHGGHA